MFMTGQEAASCYLTQIGSTWQMVAGTTQHIMLLCTPMRLRRVTLFLFLTHSINKAFFPFHSVVEIKWVEWDSICDEISFYPHWNFVATTAGKNWTQHSTISYWKMTTQYWTLNCEMGSCYWKKTIKPSCTYYFPKSLDLTPSGSHTIVPLSQELFVTSTFVMIETWWWRYTRDEEKERTRRKTKFSYYVIRVSVMPLKIVCKTITFEKIWAT